MTKTRWTEEELGVLQSELSKGKSCKEISQKLNRSVGSIAQKASALGLKSSWKRDDSWTDKENRVFAKIMAEHSTNMADAYRLINMKIGKKPSQSQAKWYYLKDNGKLVEFFKKYYDKNFEACFLFVNKKSVMYNTKISTGTTNVTPIKVSLWRRILNLFK